MEDATSAFGLYRAHTDAQSQSFDVTGRTVEALDVEQSRMTREMGDSQLVGVPVQVSVDSEVGGDKVLSVMAVGLKAVVENGGEKRKRGRPPRAQAKPPPLRSKTQTEEEDVCFICFDGGSLVLCDRKGCPKAYHPACVKRDEAFFRSKAKWNCGWHICSVCQKASHYMCYTCTYSLCKGCTKDADYLCVRGNKGFCTTCMRTIMLIENSEQAGKEMIQVDFDDKNSWEYLFKIYWLYLKGKLLLTLDELTQGKNLWKDTGTTACKKQPSNVPFGATDGKGSTSVCCEEQLSDVPYGAGKGPINRSSGRLMINNSRKRKDNEQFELINGVSINLENTGGDNPTSSVGCRAWASEELLEFVAHMKNGDISVLTQFDVQALLLDYIKRNNLRDPRCKSQIICDLRLKTLFGKPHVGHFEMLKLLEFHFLIKEDSSKDVYLCPMVVDAVASQVVTNWNSENLLTMGKDKKRRTRKKVEERMPQTNLDKFAAIDVHNISLIYLRRSLMESLVEDNDTFHDKVVGSIVRIRISHCDQKQDMYRLVQVVGTKKVAAPYKVGERNTDIKLEVLNLDKKESISIGSISNQEFSEDECQRFRQSIKCGLVKRLTVGQLREKATQLHAVRVNDGLETERLRLSHLRDRANEKGHKKELREYVEKLLLLKAPEEQQRRLCEIPEVHADPKMDPNYESEEEAKRFEEKSAIPKYSGFNRSGIKPTSPLKRVDISYGSGYKPWKNLTSCEESRNLSTAFHLNKEKGLTRASSRMIEEKASGSINFVNPVNHVGSTMGGRHQHPAVKSGSFSGVLSETSASHFSMESKLTAHIEMDKLWHYRDPNGRVQGPFSMVQLRKWSTTGLFPFDMRIWSSNEQEFSLLLTDALNGRFHEVSPSILDSCDAGEHGKRRDEVWFCSNDAVHSGDTSKPVQRNALESHTSDWSRPMVIHQEFVNGSCSKQQDSSSEVNNVCSDQPNVQSPLPSATLSGGSLVHHGGGCEGERWKSGSHCVNWNSHGTSESYNTGVQSLENQSNSSDCSGLSSGQNWRSLPEQNGHVDTTDLPSLTPKESKSKWACEAADNKQSVSSGIPARDTDDIEYETAENKLSVCLDVPNQGSDNLEVGLAENKQCMSVDVLFQDIASTKEQKGQPAEINQSVPSNFPSQDPDPSWSNASSVVVSGEAQIPEIVEEWGSYSPNPPKHSSVEESNSGLVSVSSLKPLEAVIDHVATPTSKNDDLAPPFHVADVSGWRVVVDETIEFSTLDEESVSDLLAEVDAMECQSGFASPISATCCDEEWIEGVKADCLEWSPTSDPGKSDTWSSTGDVQIPCQSIVIDEPYGIPQTTDVYRSSVKRSGEQSSARTEVVGETKFINAPINQREVGSNFTPLLAPPSTMSPCGIVADLNRSSGSELIDTGWETKQENI